MSPPPPSPSSPCCIPPHHPNAVLPAVQTHAIASHACAAQVVFTPEVAQVWIDNLADLYGNVNLLASQLFDRWVGGRAVRVGR